jgi:hypothetical protein
MTTNSNSDSIRAERTLKFPADRSLGTLYVRKPSEAGWLSWVLRGKRLKEAKGEMIIQSGYDLCLLVNHAEMNDMSPLLALDPNDLQALVFPLGIVNDDSLFYIQRQSGLELLRIDFRQIGDPEIIYLKEFENLKWLYLWGEHIGDADLSRLEDALPNCVVSLAKQEDELPHDGLVSDEGRYTVEEMMEKANEAGYRDAEGQPFTSVDQFLLALELSAAEEEADE